jgi:hypothetical protein
MSFVWNSRGFSFEIEGDCNIQHTPVDCSVSFFNSSNIAATFGGLQKIEPDPDIAGIGVRSLFPLLPFSVHLHKLAF